MKHLSKLVSVLSLGALLLASNHDRATARPQVGSANDRNTNYLSVAFPRTRELLDWLAANDPEIRARLDEHGNRLAEASEQSALQFVEQNHPELATVIRGLRSRNAKGRRMHSAAMRDLLRDTTRLRQLESRAPRSYEAAVDVWRNRSRIRLLAARMALSEDADTLAELESLVVARQAAERRQVELRLERLRAQTERLETRLASDPQDSITAELRAIRNKIEQRRKNK